LSCKEDNEAGRKKTPPDLSDFRRHRVLGWKGEQTVFILQGSSWFAMHLPNYVNNLYHTDFFSVFISQRQNNYEAMRQLDIIPFLPQK